jgi:hypothetical protein
MRTLLAALTALAMSGPASAQLGALTASVSLGWGFGEGLWSLDRQPTVPFFSFQPADTVALARSIRAGPLVTAGVAYRPGSHLGLTAEFFYFDTSVGTTCRVVYGTSPSLGCGSTEDTTRTNASYGLTGGLRMDLLPEGRVRPYLRAGLGAVVFGVSTVAAGGGGFQPTIIRDPSPHRSAATALLAMGVARPFGAHRELQLEMRDVMINFDRVTAVADPTGIAPTQRRLAHDLVLSLGVRMDLRAATHSGR